MPFFHVATNSRWWKKYFLSHHYQFSTIFNHFSAHILLHHTHLYMRRPQMNIFSCGWARWSFCAVDLCECNVCIAYIHNINFTLKTLFIDTHNGFPGFLSTCHDNLVFFKPPSLRPPSILHFNSTNTWEYTRQHSLLISFMFVYH